LPAGEGGRIVAQRVKKNGTKHAEAAAIAQDVAATYDEFKEFEGRLYTGMKVGRGHRWNYDAGVWKETKLSPDEWQIEYAVTKRRKGHAPEGSGVPVGTGYHWYIIAHQNVTKLNANDYSTSLTGVKFKLAHKRAGSSWSASTGARRRKAIRILRELADRLEAEQHDDDRKSVKASPIGAQRRTGAAPTRLAKRRRARPAERATPSRSSRPSA
jgi:hypothetical protein